MGRKGWKNIDEAGGRSDYAHPVEDQRQRELATVQSDLAASRERRHAERVARNMERRQRERAEGLIA